jgi:hypothetical protein
MITRNELAKWEQLFVQYKIAFRDWDDRVAYESRTQLQNILLENFREIHDMLLENMIRNNKCEQ